VGRRGGGSIGGVGTERRGMGELGFWLGERGSRWVGLG